jgi:hypothetical protein
MGRADPSDGALDARGVLSPASPGCGLAPERSPRDKANDRRGHEYPEPADGLVHESLAR